ncbi:MAG: oxidoreductase, partial [Candidatus Eremiobacteraeota bacterium]|nr:oxidoreductase [Candidatus Eremiobacteraeota bacterium]
TDYAEGGWSVEDSVVFARALRERGCDFIDVSGGGLVPYQKIVVGPGYQVPYARRIRHDADVPTIAVGMIEDPVAANNFIEAGDCDLVALARGMLRNPRWVWSAADALDAEAVDAPNQYARARPPRAKAASR